MMWRVSCLQLARCGGPAVVWTWARSSIVVLVRWGSGSQKALPKVMRIERICAAKSKKAENHAVIAIEIAFKFFSPLVPSHSSICVIKKK